MKIRTTAAFVAFSIVQFYPLGVVGEALDRLFFTPEERHYLEQLRWAAVDPSSPVTEKKETEVVSEEKPVFVSMGGMVKRGATVQAVWLNGAPRSVNALPSYVRLGSQGKVGQIDVTAPETGKSYSLRSGQTLELGSGRILESYEWQQESGDDLTQSEESGTGSGPIEADSRGE